MVTRLRLACTTVLTLAGFASLGCGSDGGSWSIDLSADGSVSDATMPPQDASSDGSSGVRGCGTVPPHGTQLVASPSVAIDGVTSDGYAIYTDVSNMTVNAVPIAGGPPMKIGNVDANNAVFISGRVVYFEPAVVPGTGLGIALLSVWTAAGGTATLSSCVPIPASASASGNGLADVSRDGSYLLYVETQDGQTGTVMVATTDGNSRIPLVANIDLRRSGCRPFVEFAGPSAVAAYCPGASSADAGAAVDAGPVPDAGVALDAGVSMDSGAALDSGGLRDAGSAPDAGVSRDAGAAPDTGVPRDAGAPGDASVSGDAGNFRDADVAPEAGPSRDGGRIRDAGARDASASDGNGPVADAAASDAERTGRLGQADTPPPSASSYQATVASFTGPAFAQHVLVANVQPAFAVDVGGAHVLVSGPSGLAAFPIAAGAGIPIDATGTAGTFTRDGDYVVYVTSAMALKRSAVARPAPQTLVPSGLAGLFGLSPDENWALGYETFASGGQTSDLYLASTTSLGPARRVSAWAEAAIFGDAFTVDSKYVLFFDNISENGGGGDFYVAPVSGGTRTIVASNAWVAAATAGSKMLVSDNCTTCSETTTGAADIVAFDAANPTPPVTLVSQAYASFYLTAARDKVAYSWTCMPDGAAGVYVLPVP